jgi:hypothetical protein
VSYEDERGTRYYEKGTYCAPLIKLLLINKNYTYIDAYGNNNADIMK